MQPRIMEGEFWEKSTRSKRPIEGGRREEFEDEDVG